MARKRKHSGSIVFALVADMHCGSTIGLAPPESIPLDDGQELVPSKAQRWIWDWWESEFWPKVARTRERETARLFVASVGDMLDGPGHHGTSQTASLHPGVEKMIAMECLRVPKALRPDRWFIVRGTTVHVGKSGSGEEAIAKELGAERDPDTGAYSWWRIKPEIGGVRMDLAHHGRQGNRPWTEASIVTYLAHQIFYEHVRAEPPQPYPHLAIRAHRHRFGDSYKATRTRVVQLPAWQLKTEHSHKVVTENLADIGGVIVTIRDGEFEVREVIRQPEQAPTWREAA